MQLHTFSALALSAIAAASASSESTPAPVVDHLFPSSAGALEITFDADGKGPSYFELLSDYAELTGQFVTYSKATRELLADTDVQLDRSMTIDVESVQHTTEVLLAQAGLHLAIESANGPQILRIRDAATEGLQLKGATMNLDVDQLEVARKHPAMTFSVVLPVSTTDTRQLANSARSMITDADTMQIIPGGLHPSLIVTGYGDWVYETAQWILEIEAQNQAHAAKKQEAGEADAE